MDDGKAKEITGRKVKQKISGKKEIQEKCEGMIIDLDVQEPGEKNQKNKEKRDSRQRAKLEKEKSKEERENGKMKKRIHKRIHKH